VQQKTFIPCVADVKAFPDKETHEQTDGDSFIDSVLPASEKLNGPVLGVSQIKSSALKAAASPEVSSSAYGGSNVRQARYRPMVSPQAVAVLLAPRVDSALVSMKAAAPSVTSR
jgi:hypothetical protein